ncbi:unannotated protein [freshwater metagenome]|uniref:Unannotated protein n=1 Tax=freshwater metagenome TaxID=449393 RepID=A0A6J6QD13_9ZZZZ
MISVRAAPTTPVVTRTGGGAPSRSTCTEPSETAEVGTVTASTAVPVTMLTLAVVPVGRARSGAPSTTVTAYVVASVSLLDGTVETALTSPGSGSSAPAGTTEARCPTLSCRAWASLTASWTVLVPDAASTATAPPTLASAPASIASETTRPAQGAVITAPSSACCAVARSALACAMSAWSRARVAALTVVEPVAGLAGDAPAPWTGPAALGWSPPASLGPPGALGSGVVGWSTSARIVSAAVASVPESLSRAPARVSWAPPTAAWADCTSTRAVVQSASAVSALPASSPAPGSVDALSSVNAAAQSAVCSASASRAVTNAADAAVWASSTACC